MRKDRMKKIRSKKIIALTLALVMVVSHMMIPELLARASQFSIGSIEQLDLLPESEHVGLVGFEDEYALPNDDTLVSVLALFNSEPAAVQVLEAYEDGYDLSEVVAEEIVENEHEMFLQELENLFNLPVGGADLPFEILHVYQVALNGVNIILPASRVAEIAEFASVRVVYPDFVMEMEPPPPVEPAPLPPSEPENPWGMRAGRATMRADELHNLGYRGDGVLVAVLDTGIYYNHSAFDDAFLTIEQMQARGADVTDADGIDGVFYGRNFFQGGHNTPPNDPMELNSPTQTTNHGTHVAGTIVGQNENVLGVAPDAHMFAIRMLSAGPGGSFITSIGGTVGAIEQTVRDQADVVNMSFGSTAANTATAVTSVAVNNVMIANPYMVFVSSAGNHAINGYTALNGPFFTLTSPGPGSRYIATGAAGVEIDHTYQTFQMNPDYWHITDWSSRGPSGLSFEMNPNIAAHGLSIFSTLPPWNNYYGAMSGTSMSAPHMAGAAALLIEYSRNNGGQWTAEEIKTRLMNSAVAYGTNPNISAFETGAGYVDVYAAATLDTVVSVAYDRAVHGSTFNPTNFGTTRTGSFTFGSVAQLLATTLDPYVNHRALGAIIENNNNEERTYTIDYNFIRNEDGAARLTLSRREVTVPAGDSAFFSATMSVGGHVHGGGGSAGFYEGHVYVRDAEDGTLVARLPFTLVNQNPVDVAASELSFVLNATAEAPVFPATIDTINVNHGTSIENFINTYHHAFTLLDGGMITNDPIREGYSFAGWYLDSDLTIPLTAEEVMPEEATTLYARWDVGGELTPREILNQLIVEAEALMQRDFTPLSWARLQSTLVMARSIYNNSTATDGQIEDAINLLRARMGELVPR